MESQEIVAHIKELQANADAFLATIGKADMEIYRIEKFVPTLQDPKFYGQFYDGDSYVIVKKNDKEYDIHYWHGKHATGDEMGSAAAFTVQISDVLPLPSRHHLELMAEETQLFLSYFKGGIFYLEGGVDSGFKHVEPKTYEKKLLMVKGKRYPRIFPMKLESNSLNEGDVFILDLGMKLYFWPGKEANVNEKVKGMEILFNIKNSERGGNPEHFYPRDDERFADEFWAELGGKPDKINDPVPDEGAQEGALGGDMGYALFKVSDATGTLEMTEITDRPLKRDHLDTNDCFILDTPQQIYVWIGKGATVQEKKNSVLYAREYVTKQNKPKNTKVSRIPEKTEDSYFKSFFDGFYPCIKQDLCQFKGIDPATNSFDIDKIANKERKAAQQLFEKLEGYTQEVFLVREGQPVKVDESEWGHFFSNDVYIIDLKGKRHRYVLCWMGPKLDAEQQTQTAEWMDIVTNYEHGTHITRARVRRGHEEESLLSLFPQGMIIHNGTHRNVAEKLGEMKANGAMLRIQAPFGASAKAIEQESVLCSNLNSGDAYIVVGPQGNWLWWGLGANEEEQNLSQKIFDNVFQGGQAIKEEAEPEEFWASVGGKTEYANVKDTGIALGFEPRLFHCSNASGSFYIQEILNFSQDDLINDDIMLLDAYSTIYMWIGNRSNKFEMRGATKNAAKYIDSVRDGRNKEEVQTVEVEAGKEAPGFTVHFPEWSLDKAAKWLDEDPMKQLMGGLGKKMTFTIAKKQEEERKYAKPSDVTYDLETLKTSFPEELDPARKEMYLADDVFQQVFGMDKAAFEALKKWKQVELKKKHGLF